MTMAQLHALVDAENAANADAPKKQTKSDRSSLHELKALAGG